jgi:ubiquinol-cytochrome c reductase cytochrome c subunit
VLLNSPSSNAASGGHGANNEANLQAERGKEPVGSGHDNVYVGHDNPDGLPDTDNPGRDLYIRHCSSCHGVNGEGSEQAPSLVGVGAAAMDFYISTGRMPLRAPVDQAPRARSLFTQEQTDAMVKYVAGGFGKGGPEIPKVNPEKGNLVLGNEIYARSCGMCHNAAGSGGALGGDLYAPNLYDSTPTQIAEAVRFGPGGMPIFGEGTYDQHELDSLVRYVVHLQDAESHGGLSIGRYGPVAEGFVAWVIGLGALLGIARWMGTRT